MPPTRRTIATATCSAHSGATEPAELNGLLAIPEQLSMASDYVHAVLDDLDERRPGATTELHGVLGSAVGPILVGWPE